MSMDHICYLILGTLFLSDYIFQKSTASDSFSRGLKISPDIGSPSHLQVSMIFSNLSLLLRFIDSSFRRASCFESRKKRLLDFSHLYGLKFFLGQCHYSFLSNSISKSGLLDTLGHSTKDQLLFQAAFSSFVIVQFRDLPLVIWYGVSCTSNV